MNFKKYMLPGIGGKILGGKLFGKKKKGIPGEVPEDYQGQLNTELEKYSKIAPESQQGAVDRAKSAGTYAPTSAFKEQAQAEGDAATRQLQFQAQARANALRKKLGQTEAPTGQIGG